MVNGTVSMTGSGAELLARPEVRAAYLKEEHTNGCWLDCFLIFTVLIAGGAAF